VGSGEGGYATATEINSGLNWRLRLHQPALRRSYAVEALAVVGPPAPIPHLRVLVRFAHLPDLASYLALKQHLHDVLQVEVDLLPETQPAHAAAEPALPDVYWAWP